MKRILASLLLVVLFVCTSLNKAQAQYVTIPDVGFASWLRYYYPSCMNGNQLDTTCNAVLSATNLTINGVANLNGVQYFKNLDTLNDLGNDVPGGQLDSLPTLPHALRYLSCGNNLLHSLPALPPTLRYLDCDDNLLTSLPALPANLNYLDCSFNRTITSFPSLPDSLYLLNIDSLAYLTCLPQFHRIVNFSFQMTNLPCFTSYGNVTNSNPALNTIPLCQIGNSGGCAAAVLTVNAGTDTTVCNGSSVIIGGNPTAGGGAGNYTYAWSPSVGLSSTIVSNPVVTGITNNTVYTVTVTDGNSTTATASVHITAGGAPPTSSFTEVSPVCAGANSTITYTGSASGGATYTWNFDGGTIASGAQAGPYQINWATAGTHNVTLTVRDNGCVSTITTEPILVNALPTSSFTDDPTVCTASNSTITYTGTGTPGATYAWNFAGGTIVSGAAQGPYQVNWASTGTKTVTLSVTENGCTSLVTSSPVSVVSSLTSYFITDSNLCSPTFSYWGNASNSATYNWDFDGGVVTSGSGQGPYTVSWSTGGAKNITLSVSQGSCSSLVTTVPITVQQTPTASFTTTSPVCIGQASAITYTGNASNTATWGWNFGVGNVISGSGRGPYQVSWSFPGTQFVALAVFDSGCVSRDSVVNFVTVLTNCVLPVATGGDDTTLCASAPVKLGGNPTAAAGTGPYTYAWSGGAGNIANPIVTPTTTTTYFVTVTDHNGNSATSSVIVTVLTSSPLSTFTATPVMCEGSPSTVTYTGNAPGNATYTWNFDGGTIVSGTGQGPYLVSWATGGTKIITLLVNEGSCSSTITQQTVVVNHAPGVTVTPNAYTICQGAIVTLMASGATTYSWAPGTGLSSSTSDVVIASPDSTTTYTVTGTSSGCSSTTTVIVTVDSIQVDSIVQFGVTSPVQLQVFVSGGNAAYNYVWSNGYATALAYCQPGFNSVTVTDANGCTATAADTIVSAYTLAYDSTLVNTPWYDCVGSSGSTDTGRFVVTQQPKAGTIAKRTVGNEVCLIYTPLNNFIGLDTLWVQTCSNVSPFACDTTIVVMKVYSACYQCVWPGDANDDGIVNNTDLLPIGLAYGTAGPIRNNASLNWVGQPATYWTDSLPDSTNYKFVDCNGDGLINADDTVAIVLNYSFTHARSGGFNPGRAGEPVLYPQVMEDTVYNGDTLNVQLVLGSAGMPASNVYGLAFTLNYDIAVVDTTKTTVTFGNSWLGTNADKISIAKDLKETGELQCAVTRINHTTKSGQGSIGTASFVITTDNLNGKNYNFFTDLYYISKIRMIDSVGNPLSVGAGLDSTLIGYLPTNVNQVAGINSLIHIYPNPANNQLVFTSGGLAMEGIKIMDVVGNEVIYNSYPPKTVVVKQVLDISSLSPGIYLVEVMTNKGVAVQKLIVAR